MNSSAPIIIAEHISEPCYSSFDTIVPTDVEVEKHTARRDPGY